MDITVLLLLSAVNLVVGSKLILQKCCPERYAFNLTSGKCEVVKSDQFVNWIPDHFENADQKVVSKFQKLVPSLLEFDFKYGPCPEILQDVAAPVKIDANTNLIIFKGTNSISAFNKTYDQWCLDARLDASERQWVLLSCPCLHENCITQCCPNGHRLDVKKASRMSFDKMCEVKGSWWPQKNFNLKENSLKPWSFRSLSVNQYLDNCFLSVKKDYEKKRRPKFVINFEIDQVGTLKSKSYCLAEAKIQGEVRTVAMYCDRADVNGISFNKAIAISILASIGAFFTFLTLAVYVISRDLRKDINGLIIIAHCVCLFSAYLTMALRPLAWSQEAEICTLLGTFSHFFFMSSFLWLNVRAIVIYATFRSLDSMLSVKSGSFLLYAIYALGVPALITAFMAWAQFTEEYNLPSWVVWPGFNEASCWFKSSLGRGLYFSLPLGIALLINLFLLIKTVVQIQTYQRENRTILNNASRIKGNIRFDAENFKHFATFSLLLCLSYIPEVISWFSYGFSVYYFASIVAITLRAFLLFVIFCFRRKVWLSLQRQYPSLEKISFLRCCKRKNSSEQIMLKLVELENKSSVTDSTNLDESKDGSSNPGGAT
ncbi:G-protein coupled receptor Mth2-like isoform X2 [Neocloeon triangulifer]|uniref:G-protein coupled receptor Mth2-like isoform X2 n=1 Tax=Neocloeon triangulifer TaxID=2078957 RepID=UPI00286EB4D5|nr:G-protein coupled receptor Mth2-like isoform X2 [Neocloeon triangulifer]